MIKVSISLSLDEMSLIRDALCSYADDAGDMENQILDLAQKIADESQHDLEQEAAWEAEGERIRQA